MTIGTAARLASLRQTITDRLSDHGDSADAVARCLWSIVVLEKTFPVHVQSLTTIIDKLPFDFPSSVSFPAPANSTRNERQSPYFARAEGAVQDHGISVYWLDRVSQWGDVSVYLREIHAGKVETPWSSQSTYASLIMKLHEFESKFPRKHLMSNVSLSTRSPTEIGETREYWLPWTTMQIASHAIPALLNHPFIHIVAMHPSQGGAPSRLFLQQTVDQAIFHAGWVCRLIHTMECLKVEHQDPFIGQMVAATATIPLFFQFAQDRKVAQRAVEDLAKCERYLTRLSTEWPHIAQKVRIVRDPVLLDPLQDASSENQADRETLSWPHCGACTRSQNDYQETPSEAPLSPFPVHCYGTSSTHSFHVRERCHRAVRRWLLKPPKWAMQASALRRSSRIPSSRTEIRRSTHRYRTISLSPWTPFHHSFRTLKTCSLMTLCLSSRLKS